MSARCELTGKMAQSGNRVSHANNKSRRRWMPNLASVSLMSDALGRAVRMRISIHALRSVEHAGGLDAFLLKSRRAALSPKAQRLQTQIAKRRGAQPRFAAS